MNDEPICNAQETRAKQAWHNAVDSNQIDDANVWTDTESEDPPEEQQDKDFDDAVKRMNAHLAEKVLCEDCLSVIPNGAVSCPACGQDRETDMENDPIDMVQTFEEAWSVIANAHQKRAKRMLAMGHEHSNLYTTFRELKDKGRKSWLRLQQHNDAVAQRQLPSKFKMKNGEPRELATVVDFFDYTDWAVNMMKESHITRDDVAAAAFVWYFDVRTSRSTTLAVEERVAKTQDRTLWSAEAVVAQRWLGDEEASQDPVCIRPKMWIII